MENEKTVDVSDVARKIFNNVAEVSKRAKLYKVNEYFEGRNASIAKKSREIELAKHGALPSKKITPNLSNSKIPSNFFEKLVSQKQNYALAKSFVIKIFDEKNAEIDMASDKYGLLWKEFCRRVLFKKSFDLVGKAIKDGTAFFYVFVNDNDELDVDVMSNFDVSCLWNDKNQENIKMLVYSWKETDLLSEENKTTQFAMLFDKNKAYKFNVSDGWRLIPSENEGWHFCQKKQGWGKVPFVPLKNSTLAKPLLDNFKTQLDLYDALFSSLLDSALDLGTPTLVMYGATSEMTSLLENYQNFLKAHVLSLPMASNPPFFLVPEIKADERLQLLKALQHDIYRFGYGVDYEDKRFEGTPNQLTIKAIFQNLDLYIDNLERQFQTCIENLKYFFDKWCEVRHFGNFDDLQKCHVAVQFDRAVMYSQAERVEMVAKSASLISQKTMLENNPLVQDVDEELRRLDEEKEKASDDFDFGSIKPNDEGNDNGNAGTE